MQENEKSNPQEAVPIFIDFASALSRLLECDLEALEKELSKEELPPEVESLKECLASVTPKLEAWLGNLNRRIFNTSVAQTPYPDFHEDLRRLADLVRQERGDFRKLENLLQRRVAGHRSMLRMVMEEISGLKEKGGSFREGLDRLQQTVQLYLDD